MLAETPEIFEVLQWCEDFEVFGALPFGSATIADEPYYVYEALREAARVKSEMQREHQERLEQRAEEVRKRGSTPGGTQDRG